MKVVFNRLVEKEEITLEALAEQYGLVLQVNERDYKLRNSGLPRYWTSFQWVEEVGDGVLITGAGHGETPEEAASDYANWLSRKKLRISNMNGTQSVDIHTPTVTFDKTKKLQ